MASLKTEWKVVHAAGEDLESTLNKLSDADNEIFSVQYTDPDWTIIICKSVTPETKRRIGFGA